MLKEVSVRNATFIVMVSLLLSGVLGLMEKYNTYKRFSISSFGPVIYNVRIILGAIVFPPLNFHERSIL